MGGLTLFTSYTPGAGKSYYMIQKAAQEQRNGKNVVIGFLNGKHRDKEKMLRDNQILDDSGIKYSLKQILKKNPDLVVLDEMGMRGRNLDDRGTYVYEDIDILIRQGVEVYTTANLKKFKNINPLFKKVTGIGVKSGIPAKYLDMAENIYFIDRGPEQMIEDYRTGCLFGEKYMKSKIMNKNFDRQTLESYRQISLEILKKYSNVTIIKRNS